MSQVGLIHFYYGNGKGKTTAALGLALRAAGCGRRVVLVQFLKGRDTGELASLARLPGVTVLRGQAGTRFAAAMSEPERAETRAIHNANLQTAVGLLPQCDLLVLDEVLDAAQHGLLDEALFKELVLRKPAALELVITGHKPEDWLVAAADYVTEMVNHKHPFERGVTAREGVEY